MERPRSCLSTSSRLQRNMEEHEDLSVSKLHPQDDDYFQISPLDELLRAVPLSNDLFNDAVVVVREKLREKLSDGHSDWVRSFLNEVLIANLTVRDDFVPSRPIVFKIGVGFRWDSI